MSSPRRVGTFIGIRYSSLNEGEVATLSEILANGVRLFYEETGQGDPLIFLSGARGRSPVVQRDDQAFRNEVSDDCGSTLATRAGVIGQQRPTTTAEPGG